MNEIKLCEKPLLSLEEAITYFSIGRAKLKELVDNNEDFILYNGSKRLIKRQNLENFLLESFSI